jgi:hypothetical protein
MGECICSSCKNLKGTMDETGAIEEYECEYGFPSDTCSSCESGECDITCSRYVCDDENAEPVILNCMTCGRELKQVCSNTDEGKVQCIDCFLKNE